MSLKEEIIEKVIERLTVIIGDGDYTENTEFKTLGMKSVNYSQLTTMLEDEFDIEVPYMDFKKKATISEAADYVINLIEG